MRGRLRLLSDIGQIVILVIIGAAAAALHIARGKSK